MLKKEEKSACVCFWRLKGVVKCRVTDVRQCFGNASIAVRSTRRNMDEMRLELSKFEEMNCP